MRIINNIASEEEKYHPKAHYQQNMQTLSNYWNTIATNHLEILTHHNKDELEEYVTKNCYEEVEDKYQETMIPLTSKQDLYYPEQQVARGQQNMNPEPQKIKLPALQIPKFNGDYYTWKSFQDLFIQLIHQNNSLGKAQKMYYLKSNLGGNASKLLQHLQITDTNYDTAWEILNNRYNNKRLLVSTQIQKILSQATLQQETAAGLKKLHDTSKECLLAINNMNVQTKDWDPIIVHILTQKLDKDSHKYYEGRIKNPREMQSIGEFFDFLEHRFQSLEALGDKGKKENNLAKPNKQSNVANCDKNARTEGTNKAKSTKRCPICKTEDGHSIYTCTKFYGMSINERKNVVRKEKLCTNCLQANHFNAECKSIKTCRVCRKKHNTLLHTEAGETSTTCTLAAVNQEVNNTEGTTYNEKNVVQPEWQTQAYIANECELNDVLLATAQIRVKSANGKHHILRALVDQGSQASFITENAAQLLNLSKSKTYVNISGVGNNKTAIARKSILLSIQPTFPSAYKVTTTALVLKRLTKMIPSTRLKERLVWKHLEKLTLADPTYNEPGIIDVILGADIFMEILMPGVIKGPSGTPAAQQTRLGWIISGNINGNNTPKNIKCCITYTEIDENLRRFWEIENLPTEKILTEDETKCEQLYRQNVKRSENGKYTVSLPFNDKHKNELLGDSKGKAIARLLHMERKFKTNKQLEKEYKAFMNEYLKLGHMIQTKTKQSVDQEVFYLPHHAVSKPDSTTTKLRVVFDASAKTKTGISLNDKLLTGPTLQQELFTILLRWRKHKYAYKADIEKMYRQIQINGKDQLLHKIVWRNSEKEAIKEYQLTTVTYGTRSAPYLAVKTLQQLARDECHSYPTASDIVLKDFYIDDLMSGNNTFEEAIETQQQLINLLSRGGFKLRKWSTHCKDILEQVPKESTEMGLFEINEENSDSVKALGVHWHPGNDQFQFKVNLPIDNTAPTKRSLLSEASKLFDPLGWLTPVTIVAKIMFQELWLAGINWDQALSPNMSKNWLTFKTELPALENIRIPRWIEYEKGNKVCELHGFCDASEKAYAAAVYIRTLNDRGKIITHLLAAKSRVAPISKRLSLPRLELCGAVLLAKLVEKVKSAMEWNEATVYAWTDSTVVLAWLKNHPSKWKTFIANRVSEVHSILNANQWHHVKSKENPVDVASRGINPKELIKCEEWWIGPSFLRELSLCIPQIEDAVTDLEARKISVNMAFTADDTIMAELLEKYSTLRKLSRIIANCLRFCNNARKSREKREFGQLTCKDIQEATSRLIQAVQYKEFPEDIRSLQRNKRLKSDSKLLSLNPFLDTEGIVRVGGRLQNADISYNEKHPIILPSKNRLTQLIIDEAHKTTMHGGVQLTLAQTRQQYWIINGHSSVKRIIYRCVTCFRHKAQTRNQLMGDLPKHRTTVARPFTNSGVDYAGPLNMRMSRGRGAKSYKGYIAVFVCLASKAIHLEAVSDLTAEAFLAAFKRFTGRRGAVNNLYSDNGTNFVLANKILQINTEDFKKKYMEKLSMEMTNLGTTWHFIPPSAPHFGGLWEAGVKSVKHHLKRTVGETMLTFEEITTVLVQIEACLNSRPLCPISTDPKELDVLTPGHFLIGSPLLAPPARDRTASNMHSLTRWQLLDRLQQDFWKKWSMEYLTRLQQRPKWTQKTENIKIGDIVLIKDELLPPTRWALGRITELHPGYDGLTRVASIKTKSNTLKRPITKICPLPTVDNDIKKPSVSTILVHTHQIGEIPEKNKLNAATISVNKGRQANAQPLTNKVNNEKLTDYNRLINADLKRARIASIQRNPKKIRIHPVSRYDNLIPQTTPIKERSIRREEAEHTNLPRHRNQGTVTTMKIRTSTVLLILALLLLPVLAFGSIEPIEVTPFEHHPGIYFEELGQVNLINNEWNIMAYYNLEGYWLELLGIRKYTGELDRLCNITILRKDYCTAILVQLQHQLVQLEENNDIIYRQGGSTQHLLTKRSPLDLIGTIANKLFGILDSEYATHMDREIEMTRLNEQHLLELVKNQTSVIEATVNILKSGDESIKSKFKVIDNQLEALTNYVEATSSDVYHQQTFTSFLLQTTIILHDYQRTQDAILNVLTDLQHGKIHPLLLTPTQLRNQLALIKENLPPTLSIPGQGKDGMLRIYNLMTAKVRVMRSRILFSIRIPLLHNEFYQLFKLIPVPTPHDNEFIFIEPSTDFLIVSLHRDRFYPLSQLELDKCKHLEEEEYLCKQGHPIYNSKSNVSRCEIELLNHRKQLSSRCKLRKTSPTRVWIQLHNPNSWLYVLNEEYTFNIVCGKKVIAKTLKGDGLLRLRSDCVIKQTSMTISGHNLYQTQLKASFIPTINLSQQIREQFNIQLAQVAKPELYLRDNTKEYNDITKEIERLKKEKLPEQLDHHDIHQYTVSYSMLIVVLALIAFLIYRNSDTLAKCTWWKKEPQIELPPIPAARTSRLSVEDFSVLQ